MADHAGVHDSPFESVMEQITEKLHGGDSSSSDSDGDKKEEKSPSLISSAEAKVYRLFGRERPVHKVFGGGKPADIFMWRDKKISAAVLGFATSIWVLFELAEYHLLTLVCHLLILALAIFFLCSNACTFINRSPPKIPEIALSEDIVLGVASAIRIEINGALAFVRDIACGKDLKKFLSVIAGLWALSVVGSCCNFLTLFYTSFVLLHVVPVLYEKYENQVDSFAEKAEAKIKEQHTVLHAKVLSKIPSGPLKGKKLV